MLHKLSVQASMSKINHEVCMERMLPILKASFCIDLTKKTGSKGEADKNCKSITPDLSVSEAKQSTGCAKRKRKANKKLFADYDISANDQPDDSSDSAGKN